MTIEEIEKNIEFLSIVLEELKNESDSNEELIFKKYIEFQSISKVKEYIQKINIKTQRGTIYQSKDLSEIIQTNPKNVNKNIVNLAHKIFESNSNFIYKLYN